MLRFIKWSYSPIGTNGADKVVGSMPAPKGRPMPMVEIPVKNKLKRKRGEDHQDIPNGRPTRQPVSPPKEKMKPAKRGVKETGPPMEKMLRNGEKKIKLGNSQLPRAKASVEPSEVPSEVEEEEVAPVHSDSAEIFTPFILKQKIESQFSLEILLKHQELRLIEQELAKCQIALEQLRRCTIIPYIDPTSESSTTESTVAAAKMATGSSQEQPQDQIMNATGGTYMTPRAVVDGPYTRHYARWLIPDIIFDGSVPADTGINGAMSAHSPTDPRSTRGSFGDSSHGGKSRPHRGSTGTKLHALSSGYPQPKDKSSPLIIKRTADDKLVKLVCIDCDRGDFSSAQGFINHCRIAHHRGFESHDAAAMACGQIVEFDENGAIVGSEEPNSVGGPALVHPLIRADPGQVVGERTLASGSIPQSPPPPTPVPTLHNQKSLPRGGKRKRSNSKAMAKNNNATVHSAFIPSPITPHLSAYLEKRGIGLDLAALVEETKRKDDVIIYDSSEEESDEEIDNEHRYEEHSEDMQQSRTPARSGMSPAPLGLRASKGIEKPGRKPGVSSISPRLSSATISKSHSTRTKANADTQMVEATTLSPPAIDAPSLISDEEDEEYEEGSESPSSSSATTHEPEEVDVDVEDADEASETTATDPEITREVPVTKPRRGAMRGQGARTRGRRVERHVKFENPTRTTRTTRGPGRRGGRR